MQWTFEHYKHYSAEHMRKAEKFRLIQIAQDENQTPRRGFRGKRRPRLHQ